MPHDLETREHGPRSAAVWYGGLAWLLAAQFFVAQVVVASAWTRPFSLRTSNISDLGNTACGSSRMPSSIRACSPWHAGMNASFITIGVTMALGAILGRSAFMPGWPRRLAIVLFLAAGIGAVMVGFYPENENGANHLIGAGINFPAGNAALILFGLSARRGSARFSGFSGFSVAAGCVGLGATVLFGSRHDLIGLGLGAMERFAAYPIATWQIVAGWMLLRAPESRR